MAVDVKQPRSRRALLAGLAGGLGALAASAIGRASGVRAGVDGDVVLGAPNSATTVTEINQQTADTAALHLTAPGATPALTVATGAGEPAGVESAGASVLAESTDPDGLGIWGQGGPSAEGNSLGVFGVGDTGVFGIGLFGIAGSGGPGGIGAYGSAGEAFPPVFGASGVIGQADEGGTGVVGFTGPVAPEPFRDTGIYGRADTGGTNGRGLVGFCGEGIGLLGQTTSGVGIRAFCGNNTGVALRVTGKAAFDRSGKLTISAGSTGVTKTGIGLTSASFVLATLQTNVAGLAVQSVVTNPGASTFTIRLNKAPTVNVSVAWLAIN